MRPPQVPERRARSNDDAGWVLLPRTGGPYIDEGCLTVLHNRGHADADHSQHDRYDNRLPAWTARRPLVVCYARQLMVSVDLRLAIALVQRGTISRRSQLPPNRPRESAQPHGQKIEPNPTLRHIPLRHEAAIVLLVGSLVFLSTRKSIAAVVGHPASLHRHPVPMPIVRTAAKRSTAVLLVRVKLDSTGG